MDRMGWRGLALRTIRRPEPMPGARQSRPPTVRKEPAKHTTQTPEPMQLPIKFPTLMGVTEARLSQRTAILHTPSIKLPRKGLWEPYKLRRAARVLPRRARMAVLL